MSLLSSIRRRTFESPCTVEIERSAETLEAHVAIDSDYLFSRATGSWCSTRRPSRRSVNGLS